MLIALSSGRAEGSEVSTSGHSYQVVIYYRKTKYQVSSLGTYLREIKKHFIEFLIISSIPNAN